MAITTAQIQQLYVAYLGRAADKAGLDYWSQQLNGEKPVLTLENLRANFVNEQPEYVNAYAGLTRQDTVIKIYNNLFGRAPDAAGLDYWSTGAGSTVNADQLLTAFISGASAADAKVIANKVLVSEVYTSTAGANYVKADASSILGGVDGSADSVSKAIAKLENGSLSGIAVPAGVAALKVVDAAQKATDDYQASKVTELKDLNKAVVDLNISSGAAATLTALGTPAPGKDLAFDDVDQAIDNAVALRAKIGGATSVLEASAKQAVTDLGATRDTYTKANLGNVDLAVAYEKALATNASLKKADTAAVSSATAKTDVDFTAAKGAAGGTDALAKANADAGLTVAVTDAATLYTALTDKTKTQAEVDAVSKAFSTFLNNSTDFANLKNLAATDYAKNVAVQKEADTAALVTGTGATAYKQDLLDKATADKTLADAKAADALVVKAQVISKANDALKATLQDSKDHVPDFVKDLSANVVAATDNKISDVFHFADGVKATDDFSIQQFNKGDAIYVGEGFTFNNNVKVEADGFFTGTNTGVKEVFFIQDATTKVVSAVIETNAVGHVTAAGAEDNIAVIQLAGVTSLSDVSFANGVIVSNHVAVA